MVQRAAPLLKLHPHLQVQVPPPPSWSAGSDATCSANAVHSTLLAPFDQGLQPPAAPNGYAASAMDLATAVQSPDLLMQDPEYLECVQSFSSTEQPMPERQAAILPPAYGTHIAQPTCEAQLMHGGQPCAALPLTAPAGCATSFAQQACAAQVLGLQAALLPPGESSHAVTPAPQPAPQPAQQPVQQPALPASGADSAAKPAAVTQQVGVPELEMPPLLRWLDADEYTDVTQQMGRLGKITDPVRFYSNV